MKEIVKKIQCKDSAGTKKDVWSKIPVPETYEEATTMLDSELDIYADEDCNVELYPDFKGEAKALKPESAVKMICTKVETNALDKIRNYVNAELDKELSAKMKQVASLTKEQIAALEAAGMTTDSIQALIQVAKSVGK